MADLALKMLDDSLQAYAGRDEWLARKVCADDDAIDDLYNQIYRELLTYMLGPIPRTIERATLPAMGGPQSRTHRRPRHQHRRAGFVVG